MAGKAHVLQVRFPSDMLHALETSVSLSFSTVPFLGFTLPLLKRDKMEQKLASGLMKTGATRSVGFMS